MRGSFALFPATIMHLISIYNCKSRNKGRAKIGLIGMAPSKSKESHLKKMFHTNLKLNSIYAVKRIRETKESDIGLIGNDT